MIGGIYVQNRLLKQINLVSRIGIAFLFIYHGLAPKILWLSPIEIELVGMSGLGLDASVISPLAGLGEVLLGSIILCVPRKVWPLYLAVTSLLFLLLYVAVVMPVLLVEAFNPVTTNIMGLILCYLAIKTNTAAS